MATIDTIRAVATYAIALVVVVGGGAIIYGLHADPSSRDIIAITAGFIGAAIQFVFGQEVQTRTARQAASQTIAASSTTNGNGH